MTTILPTASPARWIAARAGVVEYDGVTHVGDLTGVAPDFDVVTEESENAFLGAIAGYATSFPELPTSGWLEAGDIYQHNGACVMVRQGHYRTEHEPTDVLALFVTYRADAGDVLDWIAGESVIIGTRRMYDGTEYECIQAHTTEVAPPSAPALWRVVQADYAEWVQPDGAHNAYRIGDIVTYEGQVWECVSDYNVYAPGVFGWVVIE